MVSPRGSSGGWRRAARRPRRRCRGRRCRCRVRRRGRRCGRRAGGARRAARRRAAPPARGVRGARHRAHRAHAEQLGQAAGLHRMRVDLALDAPALHHDDAVGDVEHEVEVLLDDDAARACRACAGRRGSRRSPARSTAGCLRTARRAAAARAAGISARPSARICCSPPDSAPPLRSSSGRSRGSSVDDALDRRRLGVARVGASTPGAGSRARSARAGCRAPAARSRCRAGCARAPSSRRRRCRRSRCGRRSPARRPISAFRKVVLPTPLWPTMPTASPSCSRNVDAVQHRHVAVGRRAGRRRRARRRAARRAVGPVGVARRRCGRRSSRAAPDVDLAHLRRRRAPRRPALRAGSRPGASR